MKSTMKFLLAATIVGFSTIHLSSNVLASHIEFLCNDDGSGRAVGDSTRGFIFLRGIEGFIAEGDSVDLNVIKVGSNFVDAAVSGLDNPKGGSGSIHFDGERGFWDSGRYYLTGACSWSAVIDGQVLSGRYSVPRDFLRYIPDIPPNQ